MANMRLSKVVGLASMLVGLVWVVVVLFFPLGQAMLERGWLRIAISVVLWLPISIPAILAIYSGYHLTLRSSRDNIKRTVGPLCTILVMFSASSLMALFSEEHFETWLGWVFFAAAIFGILLYVFTSKKLLRHEGYEIRSMELLGEGQVTLLALLLWMALSDVNRDFRGDSILATNIAVFGPILAAWMFYKIAKRILSKAQRRAAAATS